MSVAVISRILVFDFRGENVPSLPALPSSPPALPSFSRSPSFSPDLLSPSPALHLSPLRPPFFLSRPPVITLSLTPHPLSQPTSSLTSSVLPASALLSSLNPSSPPLFSPPLTPSPTLTPFSPTHSPFPIPSSPDVHTPHYTTPHRPPFSLATQPHFPRLSPPSSSPSPFPPTYLSSPPHFPLTVPQPYISYPIQDLPFSLHLSPLDLPGLSSIPRLLLPCLSSPALITLRYCLHLPSTSLIYLYPGSCPTYLRYMTLNCLRGFVFATEEAQQLVRVSSSIC
ncbi:unnamed protein product [Closterium sp. Naga37s-1]|nr:unnamed protein product [Closterium sp. Naga37s-1]